MPNKFLSLKKYAHHVMLLFSLLRDGKQRLPGCPKSYQSKLQEQGVQDVVKSSKIKFELYGDLVDQGFSKFNENVINNQVPHNQCGKNDGTSEAEHIFFF